MRIIHSILKPLLLTIALLIPAISSAIAVKDIENVHVKDRNRYVTDMAGMLSAETITRADSLMADAWRQSSAEPIIVIVDNLNGEDIDDYATELFELWKPGKKDKDNGVILLISKEDHRFVIRTGYGVEGVLPDALCWAILNKSMLPYFKEENYDAGVLAAATDINVSLTNEEAREELMSKYANDADADSGGDFFDLYIIMCLLALGVFTIKYISRLFRMRGKATVEAYHLFADSKDILLIFTIASIGIMLPIFAAWLLTMQYIRRRKHVCPNCRAKMKRLDEQTDNLYLTPAQDTEEKLNSVDYDVWLCPNCNQTEILPFINKQKNFTVCEKCGCRAVTVTSERILTQPTTRAEGKGLRTYTCLHCNNHTDRYFNIEKVAAPPVVIIPGGGGGGSNFGGGGFSGGSFGGGMTGGGGASGGW